MFGYAVLRIGPLQRRKHVVADGTAGQWSWLGQGKCIEDLLNLVIDMIAFDQDVVPGEGAGGKTGVAGKDDTTLLHGKAKDLVVREGMVVQHIKAEKTESLRETAQHGIGDEVHMIILPQGTDRMKRWRTRICANERGWDKECEQFTAKKNSFLSASIRFDLRQNHLFQFIRIVSTAASS
jgi:hypothetical protein